MSTTELQIVFEGPAVNAGKIKASVLAEALSGASEVFARADSIINGETSETVVLVQSDFKHGSFAVNVQVVQEAIEHAKHIFTDHPVSAAALAVTLGFLKKHKEEIKDSLLDLYKWLKGKKPEGITPIDSKHVEITFGQNKKTVTTINLALYGDSAIREGLEKLTGPLRQEDIERISLKHDGAEQNTIEKPEAPYFQESYELTEELTATEGERDAVLIVSKLSFKEDTTWSFFEQGATVTAKIVDENFWDNVHKGQIKFGEGDMLRVRLRWKIEGKPRLVQRNVIIKVYEVMERERQLRFEL